MPRKTPTHVDLPADGKLLGCAISASPNGGFSVIKRERRADGTNNHVLLAAFTTRDELLSWLGRNLAAPAARTG